MMLFKRRAILGSLGLGAMIGVLPGNISWANVQTRLPGKPNLVFILQRGAADGLSTVIPYADPALALARPNLLDGADPLKLDGTFGLHPEMKTIHSLYRKKQAGFIHAVASTYRKRSHFDAQNIVETGGLAAYQAKDGWMNRLVGLLSAGEHKALALSAAVPPALRGANPVTSYAPSNLPDASSDLISRISDMYEDDAELHGMFATARQTREMTDDIGIKNGRGGKKMGEVAARLMTGVEAANLVMIETTGWDTHSRQTNRLNSQLRGLDQMIEALQSGLGDTWTDTLVIVATEFGRTVAANGTGGTDHGTASAMMLLGGARKGGKVIADWPGLKPANLYEGRDLMPTTRLEAAIAGAVAAHFAIDPAIAIAKLYPLHKGLKAPKWA